jgi:hypothetical protein
VKYSHLDIYAFLYSALQGLDDFGRFELTPRERMVLGSLMDPLAPEFVYQVAAAMAKGPELFAGYHVKAPDLLARQQHARAWKAAAMAFEMLHRWAADRYLHEQAGVIHDANLVLRKVEAERDAPLGPDPQWEERFVLLLLAFMMRDRRRDQARRFAQQGKKGKKGGRRSRKGSTRDPIGEALRRRPR